MFHKQTTTGGEGKNASGDISLRTDGDSNDDQVFSPEMVKKYSRTGEIERAGREMRRVIAMPTNARITAATSSNFRIKASVKGPLLDLCCPFLLATSKLIAYK